MEFIHVAPDANTVASTYPLHTASCKNVLVENAGQFCMTWRVFDMEWFGPSVCFLIQFYAKNVFLTDKFPAW